DVGGRPRGRDERLRRHDVGEHGGAADAGAFDERHLRAELGSREGRLVAAGSPSEDSDALGPLELVGHASIVAHLQGGCRPVTFRGRAEYSESMQTQHPLDGENVDPFAVARIAAEQLADATGVEKHDIALTLGSGWAKAADLMGETVATIPATDIHGFSAPALTGHVGTLRSILLPNGTRALVIGARTHFYEGHGVRRVVHSVRTAAAAGARTMILTNGAGGIKDSWTPGTP